MWMYLYSVHVNRNYNSYDISYCKCYNFLDFSHGNLITTRKKCGASFVDSSVYQLVLQLFNFIRIFVIEILEEEEEEEEEACVHMWWWNYICIEIGWNKQNRNVWYTFVAVLIKTFYNITSQHIFPKTFETSCFSIWLLIYYFTVLQTHTHTRTNTNTEKTHFS